MESIDKQTLRTIKIKTGVLKRVKKDYESYNKEAGTLKEKLEKMQAEEADAGQIAHQQDLLAETDQLLPNCKTRIEQAVDDLENVLGEHEETPNIKETEEWKAAEIMVSEAKEFLDSL